MRIALITNIPTPYRNPVYQRLMNIDGIYIHIFFCSPSEPNRFWNRQLLQFNHTFLSEKQNKIIHFNWNIITKLSDYDPEVIITSGFNPTMITAWIWSQIKRRKHIVFSDANKQSEKDLSPLHKLTRILIFRRSDAFIGASNKTLALFKQYHIPENKLFKSCLSVDNKTFNKKESDKKEFDLIFCGQFIDRKHPLFFSEIAGYIKFKKKNLKVLLVGNGPLKNECIQRLKKYEITYFDAGFVQPSELPILYQKSRVFLFPTKKDPWGLVANEALAAGLPTIISSLAGAADELIIDGYNGFVIENFDVNLWGDKALQILDNVRLESYLSNNAVKSVANYNFKNAAKGIIEAINFCIK